jgi:hypothetical protein
MVWHLLARLVHNSVVRPVHHMPERLDHGAELNLEMVTKPDMIYNNIC